MDDPTHDKKPNRTHTHRITLDLTDEQRRRVRFLCGLLDAQYRELFVLALDALEQRPEVVAKLKSEMERTAWAHDAAALVMDVDDSN